MPLARVNLQQVAQGSGRAGVSPIQQTVQGQKLSKPTHTCTQTYTHTYAQTHLLWVGVKPLMGLCQNREPLNKLNGDFPVGLPSTHTHTHTHRASQQFKRFGRLPCPQCHGARKRHGTSPSSAPRGAGRPSRPESSCLVWVMLAV